MRTINIKVYEINEHPNKESVFNYIRNNWHDLNEHTVNEVINSLKALKNKIGGTLDYSIGQTPDRSEYISFTDYDKEDLKNLDPEKYDLTGYCWDHDIIEAIQKNDTKSIFKLIHSDTEYIYSDEGLTELCTANEYEFLESGELYS